MLSTRKEAGFTLVETLAALLVFSVVTLGLVPLLLSSLRGSNLSRSYTIGRNVVQETMERVRGLPYRREVSGTGGFPKRVDVLDLYFPRGFGPGFAANVFTTTCLSGDLAPACPKAGGADVSALPAGYRVTFRARFVKRCRASVIASCEAPNPGEAERYETVPVSPSYYWQGTAAGPGPSCATAGGTAPCSPRPPPEAQMLELTTTASWNVNATTRQYSQTSLIADRRFSGQRVDASATIDYVVQISTGFDVGGQTSDLVATAGISETRLEARQVSRASHASRALSFLLSDTATPFNDNVERTGASASAQAPPDVQSPNANANAGAQVVPHFDLANAAYAGGDASTVGGDAANGIPGVEAGVAVDLPRAHGAFTVSSTAASPLGLLWVNNQAAAEPLKLDPAAGHVAWLVPNGGTTISGRTQGETTDISSPATRQVRTTAAGSFGRLRAFPTTFVPATENTDGALIEVVGFTAQTTCRSTANGTSAAAGTTAAWSATLRYWSEPSDGVSANGAYSEVSLSQALTGAPELGTLTNTAGQVVGNPLVYEEPDAPADFGGIFRQLDNNPTVSPEEQGRAPNDVYLFPVTDREYVVADFDDGEGEDDDDGAVTITADHEGFLQTAAVGGSNAQAHPSGRQTEARIERAFFLTSSPLNPAVEDSGVTVSIGSLRCRAVDVR